MHFSTLFSTAFIAVATFSDVITAHCVIVDAYGSGNPEIHGFGLGHQPLTPRRGTWKFPHQRDIAVFNSKPVHQGWAKGYLHNGCGTSLFATHAGSHNKHPPKFPGLKLYGKYALPYHNGPYGKGPYIDPKWNTEWLIHSENAGETRVLRDINSAIIKNGIPKVFPGGWLKALVYQVNADGAGPFKCKIDYLGNANSFTRDLTPTRNCHGNAKSIFLGGVKKTCQLEITLPNDMECKGSYTVDGKTAKNICMVRCENFAKNGPFGGCIPVQQVAGSPPPSKASSQKQTVRLPPKVIVINRGKTVTVTKGDIIAVPRVTIVFVNRPRVVTVTRGQIITVIVKGVPRTSVCTKKGAITVTDESPVTVTEKNTVTIENKSVITVTEAAVTVSQAPQVVTVTEGATTVTVENEPNPEATQALTKEELEAALGGEKLDPEDLEEAKNEKVDNDTKEKLQDVGGKPAEDEEDEY
ncbi:hypothetical protein TWF718_004582 [Orbilia javanica]|uniref:Uncharacterized protein n=1 Tax=Orbilia javanica TaxID=47235 RepID=A0AAN8MXU0_9PEZI